MNIEASALAIKIVRTLYEADKANVYINPRDVVFVLYVRTPAFEDEFWKFEPSENTISTSGGQNIPITLVTLKKYGEKSKDGVIVCDGATKAPDWPKGVKPATALHDPAYLSRMAMARAWANEPYNPGPLMVRDCITRITAKNATTWTAEDVRQVLDSIFGATITFGGGRRWVSRSYYSITRWFGGIFSHLSGSAKLMLLCAATLWVTGCTNGCMSPPDIVDFPSGLPELEQTQSGDLTGAIQEIVKEAAK